MNAAEEIVKYWYQNQGYFSQESIHVPKGRGAEIDLLLVKLDGDKIIDKLHVEVQVANRYVNNRRSSAREIAEEYHQKKFLNPRTKAEAERMLGKQYGMVEVRGKMANGKEDIRAEYIAIRKEMGVTVIPFENILKNLIDGFGTNTELSPVIQALQFLKFHRAGE